MPGFDSNRGVPELAPDIMPHFGYEDATKQSPFGDTSLRRTDSAGEAVSRARPFTSPRRPTRTEQVVAATGEQEALYPFPKAPLNLVAQVVDRDVTARGHRAREMMSWE